MMSLQSVSVRCTESVLQVLSGRHWGIPRVRPGHGLTDHIVVRVYKECHGLAQISPPELQLWDGDSVSGGRILPSRERLQQVSNIEQDCTGYWVSTDPVTLHILHLQAAKLVLKK